MADFRFYEAGRGVLDKTETNLEELLLLGIIPMVFVIYGIGYLIYTVRKNGKNRDTLVRYE